MSIDQEIPVYSGDVPDRTDPANFAENAEAFVDHLNGLSAPLNTYAGQANA